MAKDTFSPILIANGFKKEKAVHKDIKGYSKGADPKTSLYAEVYNQNDWWYYVWIVGNGVPDKAYPGGVCLYEPENLTKLLSTLK